MNLNTRYVTDIGPGYTKLNLFAVLRDAAVLIVAALALWMLWPLRTVPTGSRGVLTVGGAIKGIEAEGFTLIAPWQKLDNFSIRAESVDIKDADGATSDTQPVMTSLTVRYSIVPEKVAHVFEQYSHDGNLDNYIRTAAMETFKAVTARYTATDLISKRPIVSGDINRVLREKVALYGAQILNIDMTNFKFSAEYMKAINDKVTQEQLKLGADLQLLTVASQQKQKVAVAEAEATALKAKADGEAYAALKIATAQADALRVQNAALAQNKDVLELRRIEVAMKQAEAALKWNGVLPTAMYAGAPMPFLGLPTPK